MKFFNIKVFIDNDYKKFDFKIFIVILQFLVSFNELSQIITFLSNDFDYLSKFIKILFDKRYKLYQINNVLCYKIVYRFVFIVKF